MSAESIEALQIQLKSLDIERKRVSEFFKQETKRLRLKRQEELKLFKQEAKRLRLKQQEELKQKRKEEKLAKKIEEKKRLNEMIEFRKKEFYGIRQERIIAKRQAKRQEIERKKQERIRLREEAQKARQAIRDSLQAQADIYNKRNAVELLKKIEYRCASRTKQSDDKYRQLHSLLTENGPSTITMLGARAFTNGIARNALYYFVEAGCARIEINPSAKKKKERFVFTACGPYISKVKPIDIITDRLSFGERSFLKHEGLIKGRGKVYQITEAGSNVIRDGYEIPQTTFINLQ